MLALESIVNILIVGDQGVFLRLKKLKAIKLFHQKITKYRSQDEMDKLLFVTEEGVRKAVDKILFNCRVGLFLMCQEANSQREIFKRKAMEHVVGLLSHSPTTISDQLRFSKILLNFSLEMPNSKIGSTFAVYVHPFFRLLNIVVSKEVKLYLYYKDLFYNDILHPEASKFREQTTKGEDKTMYVGLGPEDLDNSKADLFQHSQEDRKSFQMSKKQLFMDLKKRFRGMMKERKINADFDEDEKMNSSSEERSYYKKFMDSFVSLEENILTSLCMVSLQRQSQPLIFAEHNVKILISFIECSSNQLEELSYIKHDYSNL